MNKKSRKYKKLIYINAKNKSGKYNKRAILTTTTFARSLAWMWRRGYVIY